MGKIINPKTGRVFGPLATDRLVVKIEQDNYLILPLAGQNKYFKIK